jgi:hypothetical protein
VTEYFLSNHVHVGLTGQDVVLLDLRRDEYLTLNQDQSSVLFKILPGLFDLTARSGMRDDVSVAEFTATLIHRGLITIDRSSGKVPTQPEVERPDNSLLDESRCLSVPRAGHAASVLAARARTSLTMRLQPLHRVISGIEKRKRTHLLTPPRRSADELQTLMNAFLFVRPFLYTEYNKCLYDSLMLVNYLAAYDVYPTLVFGVRTDPFEAHAWVQQDRSVLNCAVEHVRAFSPIMAI